MAEAVISSGNNPNPEPDDDNISLTSTLEEAFESDDEWPVNQILAEGIINGETQYLSEWAGFPLSSASWEPRKNFQEGLLKDWEAVKERQKSGETPKFHIAQWRKAVIDHWRAKFERHEARNRKREATGKRTTICDETLDDIIAALDQLPKDETDLKVKPSQPKNTSTGTTIAHIAKAREDPPQPKTRPQSSSGLQRRHTTQITSSASNFLQGPQPSTPTMPPAAKPASEQRRSALSTPQGRPNGGTTATSRRPAAAPGETLNVFAGGKVSNSGRNLLSAAANPKVQPKMLKARFQWMIEKGQRDKEGTIAPHRMPDSLISLDPKVPGIVHRRNSESDAVHRKQDADDGDSDAMDLTSDGDNTAGRILTRKNHELSPNKAMHPKPDAISNTEGSKQGKKNVVFWLNQDEAGSTPVPEEDESGLFVADEPTQGEEVSHLSDPKHQTPAMSVTQRERLSSKDNAAKHSCAKQCRIGPAMNEPILMHFDGMPLRNDMVETSSFLNQDEIVFTHTCTAHDYLQQLKVGELLATSLAAGTATAAAHSDRFERLVEWLKLSSIGLLCHATDYYVLLYPARSEEWESDGIIPTTKGSLNPLCYTVFKPSDRFKQADLHVSGIKPCLEASSRTAIGLFEDSAYEALLPFHQPQPTAQQPLRDCFCLVFPPSAQNEADLLLQWLQMSNPNSDLRCSLVPGHWVSFLKKGHGTVIFHEDILGSVYRIPSISCILHAKGDSYSFWAFRRPIARVSIPPSIARPHLDRSGLMLERVFRPGIAILVTPSFFLSQPKQAYNFLKWFWQNFSSTAQIYRRGRLVMCANIADWLLELASQRAREAAVDESEACIEMRFKSAALVRSLLPESADSDDCPIVCAPAQIDAHDEQSLVNWFGWWSIAQTGSFRKFSFICSDSPSQKRRTRIITPPMFAESSLKTQAALRGEKSKTLELVQDDAVLTLSRYIEGIEGRLLSNATFWKPLIIYRHPIGQMDHSFESRAFTYYGTWIQFYLNRSLRRVMQTAKLGGGVKTTYLGLFYTRHLANSTQGTQNADKRDPWIAILRPADLNRRPLKSLEMLIWDISMKEKIKSLDALACADLSMAQQELVNEVAAAAGVDDCLPLERVWVGSFKSSHRLTHPLDKTLDILDALVSNYKDWLPFDQAALAARGWKYVARSRPAPSYGLADEVMGDGDPVKMVFDPPRPSPESPPPECKNRLCQWAMDIPDGQDAAFTFVPTIEWYEEQMDAGYGYEHIKATSWKAVFEQYKITDPDETSGKTS